MIKKKSQLKFLNFAITRYHRGKKEILHIQSNVSNREKVCYDKLLLASIKSYNQRNFNKDFK